MIWWVIGLGLTVCAGAGIFLGLYRAVQSPAFVVGVSSIIGKAIWNVLAPYVAKRKSLEEEAADREKVRQGLDPASTRRPGAGEH